MDTTSLVPSLVVLDDSASAALPPASPKPGGAPGQQETTRTLWKSPDGLTEAGIWECGPGLFPSTHEGYDEVCQVLTGSATVHTEGGEAVELRPGSTLVMPAGWRGSWQVHEALRKMYVVHTNRAGV
ncbi:cupin domain-containing protein [Streptomyces sp. NPDC004752]